MYSSTVARAANGRPWSRTQLSTHVAAVGEEGGTIQASPAAPAGEGLPARWFRSWSTSPASLRGASRNSWIQAASSAVRAESSSRAFRCGRAGVRASPPRRGWSSRRQRAGEHERVLVGQHPGPLGDLVGTGGVRLRGEPLTPGRPGRCLDLPVPLAFLRGDRPGHLRVRRLRGRVLLRLRTPVAPAAPVAHRHQRAVRPGLPELRRTCLGILPATHRPTPFVPRCHGPLDQWFHSRSDH